MKNWLKCRKTVTFNWKRFTSSKRQPFKKSGEQDISNTWSYRHQMSVSLVSEIFRGLFSYLTHFLILIHSAQSQINRTQRLISQVFFFRSGSQILGSFITFETQILNLVKLNSQKSSSSTKQRKYFNVNKKWRVSIGAFPYNFTQPFKTQLCS